VALKVIAISFSHHTVAVPFRFVPLTFVYIFIRIDHPALTLGHSIYPVAVVAVAIFVEKRSTSVFLVLEPIASIFTP